MPDSTERVRTWTLYVCSECGWTIYEDNAAWEQPCEAHYADAEIPEHGLCDRLAVVELAPVLEAVQACVDEASHGLTANSTFIDMKLAALLAALQPEPKDTSNAA